MKKIRISFSLLFYLIVSIINAQECTSKIVYEFIVNEKQIEKFKNEKEKYMLWIYNEIKHYNKALDLILEFNETESLYYAEEFMPLDNKNTYQIALSFLAAEGKTYINLKDQIKIISGNFFGEDFYIKNNIKKYNWTVTKEAKTVLGYKCLKATATYEVNNSNKTFTKQLIAWFTPNLPFNYGPSGFGGLPGMILEIENNGFIITVKKVHLFTEKYINYKNQLKKGIEVTQKEFLDYGKKINKKIKSNKSKF